MYKKLIVLSLGLVLGACSQNPLPATPSKAIGFTATQETASGPIDLGTLSGDVSSVAYGMNDAGSVVGSSQSLEQKRRAFLWNSETGMTDLGTLGGSFAVAKDINNAGQVVGYSETSSGEVHPFFWTSSEGMRDLGTLGGTYAEATSVSDYGEVVGFSRLVPNNLQRHAFFWYAPNGMRDLGILGNRTQYFAGSEALGINNLGLIAGWSSSPERDTQALYWSAGTPDKIGLGQVPGGYYNQATGINNRNQMVGFSLVEGFNGQKGFVWRPETGLVNLPVEARVPFAISDDGVIVGSGGDYGAFYWTATSGFHNLPTNNTFGAVYGVNNERQAVGSAVFPGSGTTGEGGFNQRAALWTLPAESFNSLWDDTARPSTEAEQDSKSVELGVRFRSRVAGEITGIRYFLGQQSGPVDSVSLWDDKGQLIATTKTDFQRGGEWNRVDFTAPVKIEASRTYTASYHSRSGYYPVSENFFKQPLLRDPLEVPQNGGVYKYGTTSRFPTRTYKASNYWVDVVFVAK
jgi:probable HAF family extracellular repeat protein